MTDADRTDVRRMTKAARATETTVRLLGGRGDPRTVVLAGKPKVGEQLRHGVQRYRVTSVEPVPGRIASFLATATLELARARR